MAEDDELKKKRADKKGLKKEDVEVFIGENPGLSRDEIRTQLGTGSAKVNSWVQELIDAKLVRTKKLGRKTGHYST